MSTHCICLCLCHNWLHFQRSSCAWFQATFPAYFAGRNHRLCLRECSKRISMTCLNLHDLTGPEAVSGPTSKSFLFHVVPCPFFPEQARSLLTSATFIMMSCCLSYPLPLQGVWQFQTFQRARLAVPFVETKFWNRAAIDYDGSLLCYLEFFRSRFSLSTWCEMRSHFWTAQKGLLFNSRGDISSQNLLSRAEIITVLLIWWRLQLSLA